MQGKTADTIERIGGVAAATLSVLDPVTGVFATVLKEGYGRFAKNKIEEAERVLEEEILRDPQAIERLKQDPESTAARTFRYIRAATVGTAHENLRILARLVVHGDGSRAIPADDFLYYAHTIESLRHDEMVVLAAIIRERLRRERLGAADVDADVRKQVIDGLKGTFTENESDGLFGALQRTGFVYMTSGYGGGGWHVSPQLMRLEATVQFTEAVAAAKARK
ncbi:hypothetical protein ACOTFH_29525 [Achromobacter xylosoxidans]|jgi:hypothetical protein|nr:hypothetical protein [Achromobacter ruhlandii]